VSFLFACVIVLTNIGLDKASINVQVLLRTTSVFWITLLSFFLPKERPSLLQIIFTLIVTSGAILLSLDVGLGWSVHTKNIPAVLINLASAMCTGFMFPCMRWVVSRQDKNPELRMTIMEMTMVKMFMAAGFILIPALAMETIVPFAEGKQTVWQVMFTHLDMLGLVMGGVLVTLMFQSAVLALTVHSRALSVGLIQQFLIFPQLCFYTILHYTELIPRTWNIQMLKPTWSHITGGSLIICGTFLYGVLRVIKMIDHRWRLKQHALQINNTDPNATEDTGSINTNQEAQSLLLPKVPNSEMNSNMESQGNLPRKWYDWIL